MHPVLVEAVAFSHQATPDLASTMKKKIERKRFRNRIQKKKRENGKNLLKCRECVPYKFPPNLVQIGLFRLTDPKRVPVWGLVRVQERPWVNTVAFLELAIEAVQLYLVDRDIDLEGLELALHVSLELEKVDIVGVLW